MKMRRPGEVWRIFEIVLELDRSPNSRPKGASLETGQALIQRIVYGLVSVQ